MFKQYKRTNIAEMHPYISYNNETGITIGNLDPAATLGDITDVVNALSVESGTWACELDGAKDALEDGALWSDHHQEALECLHGQILCFERESEREDDEQIDESTY